MRYLKPFNEGIFDIFKRPNKDSLVYKINSIRSELKKLIDEDKLKTFNNSKYFIPKDHEILYWKSGYSKPLYYKINSDLSVRLYCDLLIDDIKDININISHISGNLHIRNCQFNKVIEGSKLEVLGNVLVERTNKLPFSFDYINGDFSLKNSNRFEDFDKLPYRIGGSLYLKNNMIKSLDKISTKVVNGIDISDNQITSLNFLNKITSNGVVKASGNKIYSVSDINTDCIMDIAGNPISFISLAWIIADKATLDLFNDFDPIRPPDKDNGLPILYKDRLEMFIDYYKSGNFTKIISNTFFTKRLNINTILECAENIYDIR